MNRLELTLAAAPAGMLDLGSINPATLAGMDLDQVRRLRIPAGAQSAALGDLFAVNGETGGSLAFRGLTSACLRVAHGLSDGLIEVSGQAGIECGREMRGGTVRVRGDVGDDAATGMRGGILHVSGNAGERLGAPTPGAVNGMNDGTVIVAGDAGPYAAQRMRRGLMVIGGNAGDHLADCMLAGTVVVLGQALGPVASGLRRGTVMLGSDTKLAAASFGHCGMHSLGIMTLLQRHVATFDRRLGRAIEIFSTSDRWSGDLSIGGCGEVLVARDAS